jgi:hypothetical protein
MKGGGYEERLRAFLSVRDELVWRANWRDQECDPNLAPSIATTKKDRLLSSASCRRH